MLSFTRRFHACSPSTAHFAPTRRRPNIVYFLHRLTRQSACGATFRGESAPHGSRARCALTPPPYLALAYQWVQPFTASKADAFLFFLSCLEPPGVIEWQRFGARPAG